MIPTDDPADIYKVNDPCWKTTGRIANISANGLPLTLDSPDDLEPGSKLTITFGSTAVAREVRHVSGQEGRTIVGITIEMTCSICSARLHTMPARNACSSHAVSAGVSLRDRVSAGQCYDPRLWEICQHLLPNISREPSLRSPLNRNAVSARTRAAVVASVRIKLRVLTERL